MTKAVSCVCHCIAHLCLILMFYAIVQLRRWVDVRLIHHPVILRGIMAALWLVPPEVWARLLAGLGWHLRGGWSLIAVVVLSIAALVISSREAARSQPRRPWFVSVVEALVPSSLLLVMTLLISWASVASLGRVLRFFPLIPSFLFATWLSVSPATIIRLVFDPFEISLFHRLWRWWHQRLFELLRIALLLLLIAVLRILVSETSLAAIAKRRLPVCFGLLLVLKLAMHYAASGFYKWQPWRLLIHRVVVHQLLTSIQITPSSCLAALLDPATSFFAAPAWAGLLPLVSLLLEIQQSLCFRVFLCHFWDFWLIFSHCLNYCL